MKRIWIHRKFTNPVFTIHLRVFFDKDLGKLRILEVIKSVLYLEVWIDQKRNNPNFYFSVNLNQPHFTMKNLHFEFLTNSKMCISIFHAESTNKRIQIQKIFPNTSSKTRSRCFKRGSPNPNNARSKWVFRGGKTQKIISEENFLIVGRTKMRWLNEYHSNSEFFRQLSSIPNESRYFVSLPLIVKNKD